MKAKLVLQGISRLRKQGKKIHYFAYDLGKYYSADKVNQFITHKVANLPNQKKILVGTNTVYHNLNDKRVWSLWKEPDKVNVLPTYLRDSIDVTETSKIRFIDLFVTEKVIHGLVGDDDKNDCFYNVILKMFSFNKHLLPEKIRTPLKFKKFFGVKRNDKIDLDSGNLKKLEEFTNWSFIIDGDLSYISDVIKPVNICLHIKDEHITSKCNKGRNATNINFKPVKKENVLSLKFDGDKIFVCDGKCQKSISDDEYKTLSRNFEFMLLKCQEKDDMYVVRDNYIKRADHLLEVSKGFINYYKSQYSSRLAFEIWRQKTKFLTEPDEFDDFEEFVTDWALHGGIHYSKPGEYEDVIDVDQNSMYMYYMASKYFLFPVKKGTLKCFTQDEFSKLDFYPFGYYKVIFSGKHGLFIIPSKSEQWVTHHDLKLAKLLNITFKIIEGKTNALLYDSKNCVRGDKAFGEQVKYLFNLKKDGEDVKDLTVSTWGFFCKKIEKTIHLKEGETYDIGNDNIEYMSSAIKNITVITLSKQGKGMFESPWARMGPFLTSLCRLKIAETILKGGFENCVHCNTDGFSSLIPRDDIDFNTELGGFKIKHQGNCIIENSMSVKWI